jgi:hypothetical protein
VILTSPFHTLASGSDCISHLLVSLARSFNP